MRIDVLTLFPEVFTPVQQSIPGRIQKAGLAGVTIHQLRDWAAGKHKKVDDTPYGGGPGMVMGCSAWFAALTGLDAASGHVIHMSPQGRPLDQARVLELSRLPRLIVLCGHYEGIDERVIEHWVDEEICVGDFVVSGGELPAMMLIDAVLRVLPGALSEGSAEGDSFYHGLLDHPHYTRPPVFAGREVPPVLLSGNHGQVEAWRKEQARERTRMRRPDLFEKWQKHEEANNHAGKSSLHQSGGVRHGQENVGTGRGPRSGNQQEEGPSGSQ